MFRSFIVFLMFFCITGIIFAQQDMPLTDMPPYSAEVFLPGIISTGNNERDIAVSPDGSEIYYSYKTPGFYVIVVTVKTDTGWTQPEVASFSGKYNDIEPRFSPDGTRLYYVSSRPLDNEGEPKDFDIWYVERTGTDWGEPVNIGPPVNTDKNEFYPSFTNDGSIYFTAEYEGNIGGEDIFVSHLKDGVFGEPVNLGPNVNSEKGEFNSFVSPDGDYIMFTTMGRGNGIGGGDLWICFRNEGGNWSEPVNMGEDVNSTAFEYCPVVSPDGRTLYFTSNRSRYGGYSDKPLSMEKIKSSLKGYGNGSFDLYYLDAKVIERLRPAE